MVKKILFTIRPDGEVSLDVIGAFGAECDELTAPFEGELGITARKERKDSYFSTQECSPVENRSVGGT